LTRGMAGTQHGCNACLCPVACAHV
jgi:hypothetical protein